MKRSLLTLLNAARYPDNVITLDYPYHPRARSGYNPHLKALIARHADAYAALLETIAGYAPLLARIPREEDTQHPELPFWKNLWFPALDAMSLYYFLVQNNPRYYFEVGSGFSTKYARKAIRDHKLRTRIVSVDPMPRAEVDAICDRVIRMPLEDVPTEEFGMLSAEDIFFIDSSHRSFQGSDVTLFFTEILPALPQGMIFGLHDIFLPYDYPAGWTGKYYNEQYLLASYLLGVGEGAKVLAANCFIMHDVRFKPKIEALWDSVGLTGIDVSAGAFWLQK